MKVGSIVVVLPLPPAYDEVKHRIKWLPADDEKTPYMIREIVEDPIGIIVAMLEEGIIGYNSINLEYGIDLQFLREILPPKEVVIEEFQTEHV